MMLLGSGLKIQLFPVEEEQISPTAKKPGRNPRKFKVRAFFALVLGDGRKRPSVPPVVEPFIIRPSFIFLLELCPQMSL